MTAPAPHHQPPAPATAPRPSARAAFTADQEAFFRVLGHNGGAREIVAGTLNDAGKIELVIWTKATFRTSAPNTRIWIEADQHCRAAREIAKHEAAWGNVYSSVGTYAKVENRERPGKLRYRREVPLPRHCFALDDVRDLSALRLPPTMAVETSPGNFQVTYGCDVLLPWQEAVLLAEGAALLERSDPSGADAEQLIRIPDTRNTKPKCGPDGWRVRLVFADGPTYSRSALAKAFLPNGLPTRKDAPGDRDASGALNSGTFGTSYDPSLWEGITRDQGATFMASSRWGRIFEARPQLAILAQGGRVTLYRDGAPDDTDSAQVATLICNLITSARKGRQPGDGAPPESEIRAVALFWKDTLRPGRTLEHFKAQIDYEIARYRPATYRPEPTAYTNARIADTPPALVESETKRGRPVGSKGAARLARLDLLCTLLPVGADVQCKELARVTQVSERQITDDLKELRHSGRVQLRRIAHGYRVESSEGKSAAAIGRDAAYTATERATSTGCTLAPPVPLAGESDAAPVAVVSVEISEAVADEAEPVEPTTAPAPGTPTGGASVLPLPAPAPPVLSRPQLVALVRDAFDAAPGRRITLAYVRRYVRLQDGGAAFDDGAIARTVASERQRRTAARASATFDQLRAKARAMAPAALKRASQAAAGALVQAEKKRSPRVGYYRARACIFATEEARRAELDEGDAARHAAADAALDELRATRPAHHPRPASSAPPVELPPEASPFPLGKVWTLAEQRRLSAAAAAHYRELLGQREKANAA